MRFEKSKNFITSAAMLAVAMAGCLMPSAVSADDPAEEAKNIFAMRCATCHGAAGAGDGAAAVAMDPKPKSFKDAEWQKTVTDEQIDSIIVGGGPAVGKSPLMPPNPDLGGKPEVVTALRQMVRGFGQ